MSDFRPDAPPEVHFLFEESRKRSTGALGVSLGIHFAFFALAVWLAMHPFVAPSPAQTHDKLSDQIVWLDVPDRAAVAAAAGIRKPSPSRKVELKGEDKITVPVVKKPEMEQPKEKPPEDPLQNLTIPAQTLAAADLAQAGAMEGFRRRIRWPWARRWRRNGRRHRYRIWARLWSRRWMGRWHRRRRVPSWQWRRNTAAAEGSETAVHRAGDAREDSGRGASRVHRRPRRPGGQYPRVRSLDSSFGLDQEAIKAARQWRFAPGTKQGQPVAVLVTIAIAFTLR
jgi:TonB family protein